MRISVPSLVGVEGMQFLEQIPPLPHNPALRYGKLPAKLTEEDRPPIDYFSTLYATFLAHCLRESLSNGSVITTWQDHGLQPWTVSTENMGVLFVLPLTVGRSVPSSLLPGCPAFVSKSLGQDVRGASFSTHLLILNATRHEF